MSQHDADTIDVDSAMKRFAGSEHLDVHFEANRKAYVATLHQVDIQPGWHVLDAGAGGGNYLPLIADLVGESGRITAVDISGQNVEIMRDRLTAWNLRCPVEAVEASVLDLPFTDDQFDAVWCANTSQYLSDDELDQALREFRRVTKPGGLIAIKDIDGGRNQFRPANPTYLWHMHELFRSWEKFHAAWRTWNLQRFLERVGLADVWSRTTLIEHRAPLSTVERQSLSNFWSKVFAARGVELATRAGVGGDELQLWIDLRDDNPDSVLNHPDFYATEGQVLAVGKVPE